MRTTIILTLILITLVASGCSSARGPAFAAIDVADSDTSVVYIYRPVDEGHDKFRIDMDDRPVTRLLKGGYFPMATEAGSKTLSSELILRPNLPALMVAQLAQPGSTLSLDLSPGETYYVRLERMLGPRLVLVNEAEALPQLAECRQLPGIDG